MAFLSLNANAQQESSINRVSVIEELKASVIGNKLLVNWKSRELGDKYWEVQASADGKIFSTIGLVLGADPKNEDGNYSFKQKTNSIKQGMKFYRVLSVQTETTAYASNSVTVSK